MGSQVGENCANPLFSKSCICSEKVNQGEGYVPQMEIINIFLLVLAQDGWGKVGLPEN